MCTCVVTSTSIPKSRIQILTPFSHLPTLYTIGHGHTPSCDRIMATVKDSFKGVGRQCDRRGDRGNSNGGGGGGGRGGGGSNGVDGGDGRGRDDQDGGNGGGGGGGDGDGDGEGGSVLGVTTIRFT